jgi:hypothetical protein
VLLINRPNGDTFGNNNDLNGVYTFRDGFDPIPYSSGNTVIPPGTYGPVNGQTVTRTIPDIYGEWTFTVQDAAGGDFGHVGWWSITFNNVSCPADFDHDGFVTGLDFDLYVAAFEAGDMSADFDGDAFVTGLDFDLYVQAFEAGC